MSKGTVYVVQEPKPGPKGFIYDISPALSLGVLQFVFQANEQPGLVGVPALLHARNVMKDFNDSDYILWAGGDPCALAIVAAVAAEVNSGRFNFLRWERERDGDGGKTGRGFYLPVRLNLRG
jgi:hypothetical protein